MEADWIDPEDEEKGLRGQFQSKIEIPPGAIIAEPICEISKLCENPLQPRLTLHMLQWSLILLSSRQLVFICHLSAKEQNYHLL